MTLNSHLGFRVGVQSFAHENSCPLSKPFPRVLKRTTSLEFSINMLVRAIRASMTMTRGAGGLSISQKLEVARLVPMDHLAFKVIGRIEPFVGRDINFMNDFAALLRNKITELDKLFCSGAASPHDINTRGETLLHISA